MTPHDTGSLATLLEREESARDEAAVMLQRAGTQFDQARLQAEQLERYRADYIERWSLRFSQTATIEILHCYRSFMQRLDQALAQQRAQLDRAAENVDTRRATLLDVEMRVAAVKKLLARRADEQRLVQQRRDQKQTDEAAQRAGWTASQQSRFTMLH